MWSLKEERCLGKFGGPGEKKGKFDWPTGITSDGMGNILVADARNHNRIQVG